MNNKKTEPGSERNKPFEELKPVMKEMLILTAKTTWKMLKLMARAAYHIPGLLRKLSAKNPVAPVKEKAV
jgi:hypothetical protein